MTIEEAQEKILELQGQVTELTNERDTLSQNNKTLADDLEKVRTLNQKYFNQLSAQYTGEGGGKDDEEEESQTLEEYAATLNII